jgi:hypothetical protein
LKSSSIFRMVLMGAIIFSSMAAFSAEYNDRPYQREVVSHKFFDKQNLLLFGENTVAQTAALLAIQSHGAHMESRGRTLDGYEKHFESYGYGWGAVYRYGGGVGLNIFATYMFHVTGHHKLERWVPMVAIGHAAASTGYALRGSRQGVGGW